MAKRIEFISFEEFKEIYQAEKDKKMKLVWLLGFGSGLRISEIIGLEEEVSACCKAEINVSSKEIIGKRIKVKRCSFCTKPLLVKDIRRKKGTWKIPPLTDDKINLKTHQVRIDVAKGGKWRVSVTPVNLTSEMIKLLPITVPRRTVQRRFEILSLKILGKKMSVHTLRHGFGNYQTNVLKVPIPIVQQMMGHSRLDTTGIYTKANPQFAISAAWKAMGGQE